MSATSSRPVRQALVLALVIAGFSASHVLPAGAGVIEERAARVKAAYLLNFARYARWPPDAFEQPESPIVIAVAGTCDALESLAEVIGRSEPIEGRAVELHRTTISEASELDRGLVEAEVVYFCTMPPALLQDALRRLHETGTVLTVGDVPGFANLGGMLGFVLDEDRIVFEANPVAIQESRVELSAKVLKLARIAEPEGLP